MSDLETFCRAMDGTWKVISVEMEDGRHKVTYQSIEYLHVRWSHKPYHPETVPAVGTIGRIGFIGRS